MYNVHAQSVIRPQSQGVDFWAGLDITIKCAIAADDETRCSAIAERPRCRVRYSLRHQK